MFKDIFFSVLEEFFKQEESKWNVLAKYLGSQIVLVFVNAFLLTLLAAQ